MKKLMIAALIALPMTAFAAGENNVGSCGLGSKVWVGQKGIAPQVLAVTTNGTSANQTFGITSGTLGCTQDGVVTSAWKTAMFIDGNKIQLARDTAAGHGETLDALSSLLNIQQNDKASFAALAQSQYSVIFAPGASTEDVAAKLQKVLAADTRLAKYAAAV